MNKYKSLLSILIISITILFIFSPILTADFLHWDDHVLLTQNPAITNPNGIDIKGIFTTSVTKAYFPLTILSFAIEYSVVKLNPFIYHLNNLILHLLNCFLIYALGLRLFKSIGASLIATLIFAIHPIHVESVATISERKDMLYSLFYLLAIHQYLSYVAKQKLRHYFMSIGFALLSMLAKPMAVSLPLIIILIDWLEKRPINLKTQLNKIPYFLCTAPFALITYSFHIKTSPDFVQGPLIWIWSFCFYIVKLIYPTQLTPIYLIPQPVSILNIHYAQSVLIFSLLIILIIWQRNNRLLIFGFCYYLLSIFFLLRLNQIGDTPIVADHYMYLPSLGFCFCLAIWINRLNLKFKILSIVILICSYSILSYHQTSIWKNDKSFLKRVIECQPDFRIAYNSLGHLYAREGKHSLAINNYEKALGYRKNFDHWIYSNMAVSWLQLDNPSKALELYNKSLSLAPNIAETYINRGSLYDNLGNFDSAFNDYTNALKINPSFIQAYYNRSIIFYRYGKIQDAINDLTNALTIYPNFLSAYFIRAQLFWRINEIEKAKKDLNQILKIKNELKTTEILSLINLNKTPKELILPSENLESAVWDRDFYRHFYPDKEIYFPLTQ